MVAFLVTLETWCGWSLLIYQGINCPGKSHQPFQVLTFLSHLNLSYNIVFGEIPLSTQLQSLDASGCIANELCGPPLTKACRVLVNETRPSIRSSVEKNELLDWFQWGIATGFTVGFLGVISPLLFFRSWRHVYFSYLGYMLYKFFGLL